MVAMLEATARLGYPMELLRPLVPQSDPALAGGARSDWESFCALIEAIAGLGASDRDFERLGAAILEAPSWSHVRRILRSLATARRLYWLGARWLGPSLFSHLVIDARMQPDHMRLTLQVPPEYPAPRPFFLMSRGFAEGLPQLLGLQAPAISLVIEDHRAELVIPLARERSLLSRASRLARSLWSAPQALDEMIRQQDELQRQYAELARSRRSLEQVLDRIPDAVLVHRDLRLCYANPAAAALLGRASAAELAGARLDSLVEPADRELARRHASVPDGGGARGTAPGAGGVELRLRRADGEPIEIELAAAVEIYFDDAPAILLVGRDVTERRRLDEQLQRRDRLGSLGRLAAGVAHELNNPLAYITLNLTLMGRALAALPAETRRSAERSLAAAREGVGRARAVVRDLGALSTTSPETIEPVDLAQVARSAIEMVQPQLEDQARIELRLAPAPRVMGNRGRFEQLLVHLLVNAGHAVSASPDRAPGSGLILVRVGLDNAGWTEVEISDNGCGIPSERQRRVFDPFYAGRNAGDGAGLGLAICHNIVTTAGGTIALSSAPGTGTSVQVLLPPESALRPAAASAPPPPYRNRERDDHAVDHADLRGDDPLFVVDEPPLASPAVTRLRLLLVDDEPALAAALTTVLSEHHDVVTVGSAGAALELVDRGLGFDAILCDLMMSGMSGMDLHDALRQRGTPLSRRMLFMTGGAYTPEAHAFLRRVPGACLQKPFTIEKVLGAIASRLAEIDSGDESGDLAPLPLRR
jgi:PAS domain S-box-containing protein